MSEKYKKWALAVQNFEIDTVFKDLKSIKPDKETEIYLFKILLHLSHVADRCTKENLSKEDDIFKLSHLLCSTLTKIQQEDKFYSAMYFIILYMVRRTFYKEACTLCAYLLPGKFLKKVNSLDSKSYQRIASLWEHDILKILDNLDSQENDDKNLDFLAYYFEILNFCACDPADLFKIFETFVFKLSSKPTNQAFPYIDRLFRSLNKYLTQNNVELAKNNIYKKFTALMGFLFFKKSSNAKDPKAPENFKALCCHFVDYFRQDSNIYQNFKFFVAYCTKVIESKFMLYNSWVKSLIKKFHALNSESGDDTSALLDTLCGIDYSLEMIFSAGESVIVAQKNEYDDKEALYEIGKFVKIHKKIRGQEAMASCSWCKMNCKVEKNLYQATLPATKYVKMISKLAETQISKEQFLLAKSLIKESIETSDQLKEAGCKMWSPLWDVCAKNIFNIGIMVEKRFPEEIAELYKMLCIKIIEYEGIDSKISSFGLDWPVSAMLHRLCTASCNQKDYRTAMTYSAYAALICPDSKKKLKYCDMWSNSKQNYSNNDQNLDMLSCLENGVSFILEHGIKINLSDFNLKDICVRDIATCAFESKVENISYIRRILGKLELMKDHAVDYARGTLLLCVHAMQFSERNLIFENIAFAIGKLRGIKSKSILEKYLLTNIQFFETLEKLFARSVSVSKQAEDEKFKLKNFRVNGEQPLEEESSRIMPTFSGINMKEDCKSVEDLQTFVSDWEKYLRNNMDEIANGWEPKLAVELLIICAEYLRLYKFAYYEEKAWKVAYKLAFKLADLKTCTYITGRCISLRYIDDEWIERAEKFADSVIDSQYTSDNDVAGLFWLSLADFYCSCGEHSLAKPCLEKVKKLKQFTMTVIPRTYLYYTDIVTRNFFFLDTSEMMEEYSKLLVEIHYCMISIDDYLSLKSHRFWETRFKLYSYELLFESMYNVAIPMNSLLAYREINRHMLNGLKLAQKLGMSLRISQFLRYFCYVDLLRGQANDCEARLRDLEHILSLERVEQINVISADCATPVSKKSKYVAPNFLKHGQLCHCFMCSNLSYQYQVFACTHIRAQLYTILNFPEEAGEYFYGAVQISLLIEQRSDESHRKHKNFRWKSNRNYVIDYVLYLLDFAMYSIDFNVTKMDEATMIIEKAIEICEDNQLGKHCVCLMAKEICCQQDFYQLFKEKLPFVVPNIADIPIEYVNVKSRASSKPNLELKLDRNPKKTKTLSPPLKSPPPESSELLDLGFLSLSSSEPRKTNKRTGQAVRRKILEDFATANNSMELPKTDEDKSALKVEAKPSKTSRSLNNNLEVKDKAKPKRGTKSLNDEVVVISRPKRSTRSNSEAEKEPEKSENKRSTRSASKDEEPTVLTNVRPKRSTRLAAKTENN